MFDRICLWSHLVLNICLLENFSITLFVIGLFIFFNFFWICLGKLYLSKNLEIHRILIQIRILIRFLILILILIRIRIIILIHRIRTKKFTIRMEPQKTLNSQSNLEKEKWSWRKQASWLQIIPQSYSNQDSMALAQKQECRSMVQDRMPRDKPKHIWSPYLW